MGSHHQFQDIQGLASQQPASADMVFFGLRGGVASLRSQAVLSRDGGHLSVVTPHDYCAPFGNVCAYGFKRGRRRGQLGVSARVLLAWWRWAWRWAEPHTAPSPCLACASEYRRGLPLRGARAGGVARRAVFALWLLPLITHPCWESSTVPGGHTRCAPAVEPLSGTQPPPQWPSCPGTAAS